MIALPPVTARRLQRPVPVLPLSLHDQKTADVRRFVLSAFEKHSPGAKVSALDVALHTNHFLRPAGGTELFTLTAVVDGKKVEAEGSAVFSGQRVREAELIIGRGWVDRVERDAKGAWAVTRGLNYGFIDA